jgi:hypothetical protein
MQHLHDSFGRRGGAGRKGGRLRPTLSGNMERQPVAPSASAELDEHRLVQKEAAAAAQPIRMRR